MNYTNIRIADMEVVYRFLRFVISPTGHPAINAGQVPARRKMKPGHYRKSSATLFPCNICIFKNPFEPLPGLSKLIFQNAKKIFCLSIPFSFPVPP